MPATAASPDPASRQGAAKAAPTAMIGTLQAGRALAALAVVFHHAFDHAKPTWDHSLFAAPMRNGYLGVDFFFVLSGFIIFHATSSRNQGGWDYARARFQRIYPAYWPVGVAMAVILTLAPGISSQQPNYWTWPATLFLAPVGQPALVPAWTLTHEMVFYVLFPLLLYSGRLVPGLVLWIAVIGGLAALDVSAPTGFQPIDVEFSFGILACLAARQQLGRAWHLLVAAALVGIWVALGADKAMRPLIGAACACVIPWMVQAEWRGLIRPPGWLVFLGATSYALYLVHWPCLSVVHHVIHGAGAAILPIGVIASLIGGIVYHLAWEKPVANWFRRRNVAHARA